MDAFAKKRSMDSVGQSHVRRNHLQQKSDILKPWIYVKLTHLARRHINQPLGLLRIAFPCFVKSEKASFSIPTPPPHPQRRALWARVGALRAPMAFNPCKKQSFAIGFSAPPALSFAGLQLRRKDELPNQRSRALE